MPAAIIAYGSLLPMALAVVLIPFNEPFGIAGADLSVGLIGYSSLLLAFLAGTRFGQTVRVTGVTITALATAIPVVVAVVTLFIPQTAAAGLLATAFAAQGAWDVWSADQSRLPRWYGRLRLQTTPIAVLILVGAVVALGSGAG